MEKNTAARIVFCTHPETEAAKKLAATLVDERLAACVNIIPAVTSIYSWQSKTETDQECQLIIKTTESRLDELEKLIQTEHPYELPELIAVSVSDGSAGYLDWIQEQTRC